jgi:GAF domain-containing protein
MEEFSPEANTASSTALRTEDIAGSLQRNVLDSADVGDFLSKLARHAADTLSSAETEVYSSVTLLQSKRRTRSATSSEVAQHMDETQYDFGQGPCLSAAREGRLVHVPDTARERNWRAYLDTVRDTGIRSILAVPFALSGDADGALNLYATQPEAFTEDAVATAQRYAEQASTSLGLAVRIGQLAETQGHLEAAMQSRTVIDLAVGILMERNSCGQRQAFGLLKSASSRLNLKLREVASQVVSDVSHEPVETHFSGD